MKPLWYLKPSPKLQFTQQLHLQSSSGTALQKRENEAKGKIPVTLRVTLKLWLLKRYLQRWEV